jgi:hypothetical protein
VGHPGGRGYVHPTVKSKVEAQLVWIQVSWRYFPISLQGSPSIMITTIMETHICNELSLFHVRKSYSNERHFGLFLLYIYSFSWHISELKKIISIPEKRGRRRNISRRDCTRCLESTHLKHTLGATTSTCLGKGGVGSLLQPGSQRLL